MISLLFQGVFAVTGSSTVMVVKPVLKEGKYQKAAITMPNHPIFPFLFLLGFCHIPIGYCPTKHVPLSVFFLQPRIHYFQSSTSMDP